MLDSIMRRANDGALVIAVLHDLNLAALCAERIVVVDRGRIASDGPPATTITDDMLDRVFGVETTVSRAPASALPFLLPHGMKPRRR
jgi:iron complex transport system ATP-binding protein